MLLYSVSGWESLPSTLDNVQSEEELAQQLMKLGFPQHQEFLYRAGKARIYTRQPLKIASPPTFNFCCVLTLGSFAYIVGLKNFEDVLQFLKEIDAQPLPPSEAQLIKLADIDKMLLYRLTEITKRLGSPTVTLRNVSSLKMSLDRLSNILETFAQSEMVMQQRSSIRNSNHDNQD